MEDINQPIDFYRSVYKKRRIKKREGEIEEEKREAKKEINKWNRGFIWNFPAIIFNQATN